MSSARVTSSIATPRGTVLILSCSLALASGCNCGRGNSREAIDVTGLGAAGFNYTQGTYVIGFVFRAKSAIKITQLGFYDSNLTGRAETFESHAVGVYDLSTHALLGSTTVDASNPVTAVFRYATLTSPIALGSADTYAVVGVTGTNFYTVGIRQGEAPVDPALVYVSGAGYSETANNNAPTQTSALVEPNAFDTGNIFGEAPPVDILADFGPNFMFVGS